MFTLIAKFFLTVGAVAGVHMLWKKAASEEKRRRDLEDRGENIDISNPLSPRSSMGNKNPWPLVAAIVTLVGLFFISVMWAPINEHQPNPSRDLHGPSNGAEHRSLPFTTDPLH